MRDGEEGLPDGWPGLVKSAVVDVASMAFAAMTATRSWAVNSPVARVRLAAKLGRAEQEVALLREDEESLGRLKF